MFTVEAGGSDGAGTVTAVGAGVGRLGLLSARVTNTNPLFGAEPGVGVTMCGRLAGIVPLRT